MSRPAVLATSILLAALVVGAAWLITGKRGAVRDDVPDVTLAPRPAAPEHELAAPVGIEVEPELRTETRRSEVEEERATISGTVVVPGGIPPGEDVYVIAELRSDREDAADERRCESHVARDGSFSVVVPANATDIELWPESRFLYMAGRVSARAGDTGVLLRPTVLAIVELELSSPGPLSSLGATWKDVMVFGPVERESTGWVDRQRSFFDPPGLTPEPDGHIVLSQVPPEKELEVRVQTPFGPDAVLALEPLLPGEKRTLAVALERGVTVAGKAVDEHGEPVAGVFFRRTSNQGALGRVRNGATQVKSKSDGSFEWRCAPRELVELVTESDDEDFARPARASIDCAAGDVADLVLTVVRGGCIEATVTWPDGSPVSQFQVSAVAEGIWRMDGGAFGKLELCGLDDQDVHIELRATRNGVSGAVVAVARPGPTVLQLVMQTETVMDVVGTVEDEHGQPVADARVDATGDHGTLEARISNEGFVLKALSAGRWLIQASAAGHLSDRTVLVVGIEPIEPLRFVLHSAGVIRGTVLAPDGTPVAKAWVGDVERAFTVRFFGPRDEVTDSAGHFEVAITSSAPRIVAMKPGFAPSAVAEVAVEPGADAEGLVLHLAEACRVEGRVLDVTGQPLAGARVIGARSPRIPGTESDAQGRFTLEGLAPGPLRVTANHRDRKQGALASTEVVVVAGETSFVELRFEDQDPVRLRGRFTRGGKAVACGVNLRSKSYAISGETGADGLLELLLQRPGPWTGSVILASDIQTIDTSSQQEMLKSFRRFELTVPDAGEHEFELDFDALPRITSFDEMR